MAELQAHDAAVTSRRTGEWKRAVVSWLTSHRQSLGSVGYGLALLLLAIFSTNAALRTKGWPANHEFYAHFERVETFRRAYQAGDFFPLWTPFSNNGHGSPIPFFYHRLFNTIASVIAFVLGSTYQGVKLAITLVALIGAVGMDRAIRVFSASRLLRFCGAALFVCAPYVLSDWLVRGSTAEFTAFMLLPWLYAYCMRLLRGDAVGGRMGLVVALLFYAHNALCYFAVLIPAVTAVIRVFDRTDGRPWWRRLTPFAWSALVFLLVAGPYIAVTAVTAPLFNLAALNRAYSPIKNMQPLEHYIYDPAFRWGHMWNGLSLEIGQPILALMLVMVTLDVAVRGRCDRRNQWLLVGTLALYFFLQMPASGWFYLHVPGAFFLGFPWRLITMLTTGAIILGCSSCQCVLACSGSTRRWVVLAVLVVATVFQMAFALRAQALAYEIYPRREIDRHLTALDVPTVGEYLPTSLGGLRRAPPRQPLIAWTSCSPVTVSGDDPTTGRHLKKLEISADSSSGCIVRLNQFFSPFLRVEGASARCSATPERTIELVVPPGRHSIVVSTRGLWGVFAAALRG
jgi:hypothetical protein